MGQTWGRVAGINTCCRAYVCVWYTFADTLEGRGRIWLWGGGWVCLAVELNTLLTVNVLKMHEKNHLPPPVPTDIPPTQSLSALLSQTRTDHNQSLSSTSSSSLSYRCTHTHIDTHTPCAPVHLSKTRRKMREQEVREESHNILCDPAFTSLPSLPPSLPRDHGK